MIFILTIAEGFDHKCCYCDLASGFCLIINFLFSSQLITMVI